MLSFLSVSLASTLLVLPEERPAEPRGSCVWARSNALAVSLPRYTPGALAEVQFCPLGKNETNCTPTRASTFLEQGRSTGRLGGMKISLFDLAPSTAYAMSYRELVNKRNWTERAPLATCSTLPLLSGQVEVHLEGEPELGAMAIRWTRPRAVLPTGFAVSWGRADDVARANWTLTRVDARQTSLKLRGLPSGVHFTFEVRALPGPWSDPVTFRTRAQGVVEQRLVRISELCGEKCEPDYLTDHNSGDAKADVSFFSVVTSRESHEDPFKIDFPKAVITEYCIEHADEPFREYLSCNGPGTTNYTCSCNNYIDRVIARGATSMCHHTPSERPYWKACECADGEVELARKGVGQLEIFVPFPTHGPNATELWAPPRNESLFMGYWYTTPGESECAHGAAVGVAGCKWRRVESAQTIVRGSELIADGWLSIPHNSTTEVIGQIIEFNHELLESILRQRTPRCCGC